ncbi:MAG TPA: hypothetical protein VEO00_08365, partial [Actinomycetota bacterium]|nr:hypothetical protein [Actinomycetota bacterium]
MPTVGRARRVLGHVRVTGRKRLAFFVLADAAVFTVSLYGAFTLRFELDVPRVYLHSIPYLLALVVVVRLAVNALFRLYSLTWRFVGTRDMLNVVLATILGTVI